MLLADADMDEDGVIVLVDDEVAVAVADGGGTISTARYAVPDGAVERSVYPAPVVELPSKLVLYR